MEFRPDRRAGIIAGLVILVTIVSIQGLVLANVLRQGPGLGQYLTAVLFVMTLPALALWAHYFYELVTLTYRLDRGKLVIRSGWLERTVPLRLIERHVAGAEVAAGAQFHGIAWPGFGHGHLHLRNVGRVRVYSTAPLERHLILVCQQPPDGEITEAELSVAISPRNPAQFIRALETRRQIGPLHAPEPALEWHGPGAWPVWRDGLFWALALAAVVLGIALYGLLALRYDQLPTRLPLHYGADGLADRVDLKQYLLVVPAIGTLVTAINGLLALLLHRRQRLIALLLNGGSVGIVALLWVALAGLVY